MPWRAEGTSAWGILVSEVMSQQTPMVRVAPRWTEWMRRWPTPADLADASPAEVLLAWDSLGYPRRALRLRDTARAIADDHDNAVPVGEAALRALPGVGDYTAAAVTAFAHRQPATVLDVNIRRVLGRVFAGRSHPTPAPTRAERDWAAALVPTEEHVEWNAGLMEFGALVCTSRNPACEECPLQAECRWFAAGRPADAGRKPTTQAWHGTDRQLRGAIMAVLRAAGPPGAYGSGAPAEAVAAAGANEAAGSDAAAASETAPAGAGQVSGVARALLTAGTADLDAEALAALPDRVEAAVLRVRELGDSERVDRLVRALVADGLAAESGGVLHLPQ
nr:A/G-specific adenine glycosylase [Brevibacterium sp. R8603A2]